MKQYIVRLIKYTPLVLTFFLPPTTSQSAESSITSRTSITTEYNDNIRLTTVSQESDFAVKANAGVRVDIYDEKNNLYFYPRIRASRYSRDHFLDSNDYLIDLSYSQSGKKMLWRTDAGYVKDTALTSEFKNSGLVHVRADRTKWDLKQALNIQVGPRSRLKFDFGITDVGYDAEISSGLVDYRFISANGEFRINMDELNNMGFRLYASKVKAAEISNKISNYGLQISHQMKISQLLSINSALGFRISTSEFNNQIATESNNKNGYVASVTISRNDEYGDQALSVKRSVDPSSIGTLVQRDSLSADYTTEIGPELSTSFGISYSRQQALQTLSTSIDRKYGQFTGRLSWRFSPTWYLWAIYRFQIQKFDEASDSATSNLLGLTIGYNGTW